MNNLTGDCAGGGTRGTNAKEIQRDVAAARRIVMWGRAVLLFIVVCALLGYLSNDVQGQQRVSPLAPSKKTNIVTSEFSGIWVHTRTFEYENQEHIFDSQFHLVQRGARVCGCALRAGVGGRYSVFLAAGEVQGDVLDLYLGRGDGFERPEEHHQFYPFAPVLFHRFQRRGESLWDGITTDLAMEALSGLPPIDQTKFSDSNDHRLRSLKVEGEACEYPPTNWPKFLNACLADTNRIGTKQ